MSKNRKSKAAFKDRLAAAKLPERSVSVCLRGDLVGEHEELERQLKRMRTGGLTRTMADASDEVRLAERITELEATMAEETEVFRIRALPRHEWSALVEKYPPPEGDAEAAIIGADLDGLMSEAIPRCVIEPEMDAEDWDRFSEVAASKTWDDLQNAVWNVNRGASDVPKSRLASRVIQQASVEPKQPEHTD